jgi:hypothetical protein
VNHPAKEAGTVVIIARAQRAPERLHLAGGAGVAGAMLAIAGNAAVLAADPAAPAGTVSYPLSPGTFAWGQVFFAATQALIVLAVGVLAARCAQDTGRAGHVAAIVAIVGYALTVPGELVLAAVASRPTDSAEASAASSVFGLGLAVGSLALVVVGIVATRAGSQRGLGALAATLGAVQILIVTPVVLSQGFASLPAFAVLTLADLLVAAIGVRLTRL